MRRQNRLSRHGVVTLVGDAAHPMLQYLAQGAGRALKDVVVLTHAVIEHAGNIPAAFTAYKAQRAPRTD